MTEIFDAILAEDTELVARLAAEGGMGRRPSASCRLRLSAAGLPERGLGLPPLLFAAFLGCSGAVEALLNAGAKPGQSRADKYGPGGRIDALTLAAEGGHTRVVRQILAAGYPSWKAKGHVAELDAPSVVTLLEAGLPVEGETHEDGGSALMGAAADDDLEKVRALLAAGADPEARDRYDGGHALSYAAKAGARTAFAELAAGVLIETFEDALDRRRGDLQTMWEIARKRSGASFQLEPFGDDTTFFRGASVESFSDARVEEIAADSSQDLALSPPVDMLGRSPLHWAAELGRPDLVERLLARGHQLAFRTRGPVHSRRTVLGCAIEGSTGAAGAGAFESLLLLLQNGADPNAADNGSPLTTAEPALLVAVDREVPDLSSDRTMARFGAVTEALLSAGATVDARDRYGRGVLEITRLRAALDLRRARDQFEEIAALLAANGAKDDAAADRDLVLALYARREADARDALAAGASPGARDHSGRPVIHLAIRAGLGEIVEALLKAGASPDARARGDYGAPALFEAIHRADRGSIERLVRYGADVSAPLDPDMAWQTPEAMLTYWGWTELLDFFDR